MASMEELESKIKELEESLKQTKRDLNLVARYCKTLLAEKEEKVDLLTQGFSTNSQILSNHSRFLKLLAEKTGLDSANFEKHSEDL